MSCGCGGTDRLAEIGTRLTAAHCGGYPSDLRSAGTPGTLAEPTLLSVAHPPQRPLNGRSVMPQPRAMYIEQKTDRNCGLGDRGPAEIWRGHIFPNGTDCLLQREVVPSGQGLGWRQLHLRRNWEPLLN